MGTILKSISSVLQMSIVPIIERSLQSTKYYIDYGDLYI